MSDPLPRVKEPHLAGRWYPADATTLASRLRELAASNGAARRATALLVPHGPLEQSGAVAGAAYAVVAPPRRPGVLAPTPQESFPRAWGLPVTG